MEVYYLDHTEKYHSFDASNLITHAVQSQQYRQQQTGDIFQYSFVLWR